MGYQVDHGPREQRQRLDPTTTRAHGCTQHNKPGTIRQQEHSTRCAGVEWEEQAGCGTVYQGEVRRCK